MRREEGVYPGGVYAGCTYPGGVYTGVYIPGWCTYQGVYAGYTHQGIPPPYYTPGTPLLPPYLPCRTCCHRLPHSGGRESPGLKKGERPGWEASASLRASRVSKEKGDLCAELLRFPRKKKGRDRIDEGLP